MTLQLVTKSAEVKLMEFIHELENVNGWCAVHFHLGTLIEQYQSEYQFKIATNLIYDLLKDHEGGVFLLADNGVVVLCQGLEENVKNKIIFQLRYLYMDDPLAYTVDGEENPAFCDTYDLSHQWQAFSALASKKMALSVRKTGGPASAAPTSTSQPARPVVSKESPTSLASLERELKRADISTIWRRQPVCVAQKGTKVRRVFDELYIHIADLRKAIVENADFFSNRWLFKYVTGILDQRMIQLIRDNPQSFLSPPVSLNLNVETLLSSWFSELDSVIPESSKVSVVIEVSVLDAFADMDAFMLARDDVQKLGYRLCLDGLNTHSFIQLEHGKLGADLIKLQWNADMYSDLSKMHNQKLSDAIKMAGSNRVVLSRCDNSHAVEYGQALGIALFQGRYLDSLVNPYQTSDN